MKKLTSIIALSTLAFSISAMANSTDFGTAAEKFIDNYNARSAFGTYSQVNFNGTNCSNNIVPVEDYDITSGGSICYDGLQNLKDGTAYIEYTTQGPYGSGGAGYIVYLKDKLTNVNVKLTDKAGNNVPASTLNLEGVYDSQDGSKTVIFLKAQDPLYNGDNTMDGQISISGTVVGVDATFANAEFEAAVKQVSKDALQGDMQELGYFAGSGAEAISLLIDDKTQTALKGYATTDELPDLSGYAKSSEIPSVAGLATTAYVSTIKDLASNADTKAQQALNTANSIDLQTVLNRLQALEDENARLTGIIDNRPICKVNESLSRGNDGVEFCKVNYIVDGVVLTDNTVAGGFNIKKIEDIYNGTRVWLNEPIDLNSKVYVTPGFVSGKADFSASYKISDNRDMIFVYITDSTGKSYNNVEFTIIAR